MDRAVFLDRDGVLNVDRGYMCRRADFEWIGGVFAGLRRLRELGYRLVVVTNQSGIARGYYTEADFAALTAWMEEELRARGIALAAVYYCPHHPEHGIGAYRRHSDDRKPGPGMILRARDELGVDLAQSALVGDRDTDVEAARRAGVGARIQVPTNGSGAFFADVEGALRRAFAVSPDILTLS